MPSKYHHYLQLSTLGGRMSAAAGLEAGCVTCEAGLQLALHSAADAMTRRKNKIEDGKGAIAMKTPNFNQQHARIAKVG
jgi:hypothetical protein